MSRLWTADLRFRGREVTVLKTGARLRIDADLLWDVVRWLAYYGPLRAKAAWTRLIRPGARLWFSPDRPRPWYLIWAAAAWGGCRMARSAEEADAAFYFDDATEGALVVPPPVAHRFNYDCLDVSKSRVAAVFQQVFGYALAIDPRLHAGPAVEKGEMNGAHDGRVVQCPCEPLPGRTYQKLIDNAEGDCVADLRTPFVGGRPVLVFIKRRPLDRRFANLNTAVVLTTPEAVFTPEEIKQLSAFAQAMSLDWGGLDVLRDRTDGRLYVVDVNKTDMGPPLALPISDKLRATAMLSRALRRLVRG